MEDLSVKSEKEILEFLNRLRHERSHNLLAFYKPYQKQRDFHAGGKSFRERLMRAGNQSGKTYCGAAEAAYHLTGLYPDWWEGRRWDRGVTGWCGGPSGELVRDSVQRLLLGRVGELGTGLLPSECVVDVQNSRGVADAVDYVKVRHVSGMSTLKFKNYEQGRDKWQAETVDFVWFDEEPGSDIYSEGLTRTNATGGIVWITFTPLLGMSEVVRRFLQEDSPDRLDVCMTIDDVGHISDEEKKKIIRSYAPHERDARLRGVPSLGSGRVFPVGEDDILVDAFSVPAHWSVLGALDFGWDHPTAAVQLAWDRDSDVVYVTKAYRKKESSVLHHVTALKGWGDMVWVWPHDGLQHDKGSGVQLARQYREAGLRGMMDTRVTFSDGGNGVEAGLMMMLERMETGRLRVFSHLADWLEEFRLYHRKDGKLVKMQDDLMSATRYGIMGLRHSRPLREREAELDDEEKLRKLDRYGSYGSGNPAGWMGV